MKSSRIQDIDAPIVQMIDNIKEKQSRSIESKMDNLFEINVTLNNSNSVKSLQQSLDLKNLNLTSLSKANGNNAYDYRSPI